MLFASLGELPCHFPASLIAIRHVIGRSLLELAPGVPPMSAQSRSRAALSILSFACTCASPSRLLAVHCAPGTLYRHLWQTQWHNAKLVVHVRLSPWYNCFPGRIVPIWTDGNRLVQHGVDMQNVEKSRVCHGCRHGRMHRLHHRSLHTPPPRILPA
jgi:hypothetical protein